MNFSLKLVYILVHGEQQLILICLYFIAHLYSLHVHV